MKSMLTYFTLPYTDTSTLVSSLQKFHAVDAGKVKRFSTWREEKHSKELDFELHALKVSFRYNTHAKTLNPKPSSDHESVVVCRQDKACFWTEKPGILRIFRRIRILCIFARMQGSFATRRSCNLVLRPRPFWRPIA